MSFRESLARTELPRRILGAAVTPLVPGAGHVILGYPKLGATIGVAGLALVGLGVVGALFAVPLFLIAIAMFLLLIAFSVVTMFALPPGPGIQGGLRSLWPVFVLVLAFQAALRLTPHHLVGFDPATDDSLAPQVRKGDVIAVHPGSVAAPGDIVLVDDGALHFRRYDASISTSAVRGRALFVFMSASDGRGRIWHALR